MMVQNSRAGAARYQGPIAWANPSGTANANPRMLVTTRIQTVVHNQSAASGEYCGIQSQRKDSAHQTTKAAKRIIITMRWGTNSDFKDVMAAPP